MKQALQRIIFLGFFISITFCFNAVHCSAQAPNTWVQKTNYGGGSVSEATGFSIGTKGYIGTGYSNFSVVKTFWEWDQSTNIWTQKADFAGPAREAAAGFSIGTKGYIGTGFNGGSIHYKDFWEWDQATNTWTQKTDLGGSARGNAIGFSIGTKGYIGTGDGFGAGVSNDFWEWNQATNTWLQKANFPGTARFGATGFSLNNLGYIGTGADSALNYLTDFYGWNQSSNTWVRVADFPGAARYRAKSFSLGNYGFVGTGSTGTNTFYTDFYQFDPTFNTWFQEADLVVSGSGRTDAVAFSIGTKGYIGTGTGFVILGNDFREISPLGFATVKIGTISPSSFCAGSSVNVPYTAYYTFNNGNVFTAQLSDSSGSFASPVNIGTLAITGSGTINATIPFNSLPGKGYRIRVVSSTPAETGTDNGSNITINSLPTALITAGDSTTFCSGDSVALNANTENGLSYQWQLNGGDILPATASSYFANAAGIYTCIVADSNCNATSNAISVTVNTLPVASITAGGAITFCSGDFVLLNADTSKIAGFQWQLNTNVIPGATASSYSANTSGDYTCMVSNSCGNATSNVIGVTVNPLPAASFSLSPDSTQLHHYIAINNSTGVLPLSYYWSWGDATHDTVPYPTHTYSDSGFYTICLSVTDSNNCSNILCDSSFHIMRTTNYMIYVNVIPPIILGEEAVASKKQEINIYPNPANDLLNISSNGTFVIFNILGEQLLSGTLNPHKTLNIKNLSSGIYFLKIENEKGRTVKRFVKE